MILSEQPTPNFSAVKKPLLRQFMEDTQPLVTHGISFPANREMLTNFYPQFIANPKLPSWLTTIESRRIIVADWHHPKLIVDPIREAAVRGICFTADCYQTYSDIIFWETVIASFYDGINNPQIQASINPRLVNLQAKNDQLFLHNGSLKSPYKSGQELVNPQINLSRGFDRFPEISSTLSNIITGVGLADLNQVLPQLKLKARFNSFDDFSDHKLDPYAAQTAMIIEMMARAHQAKPPRALNSREVGIPEVNNRNSYIGLNFTAMLMSNYQIETLHDAYTKAVRSWYDPHL